MSTPAQTVPNTPSNEPPFKLPSAQPAPYPGEIRVPQSEPRSELISAGYMSPQYRSYGGTTDTVVDLSMGRVFEIHMSCDNPRIHAILGDKFAYMSMNRDLPAMDPAISGLPRAAGTVGITIGMGEQVPTEYVHGIFPLEPTESGTFRIPGDPLPGWTYVGALPEGRHIVLIEDHNSRTAAFHLWSPSCIETRQIGDTHDVDIRTDRAFAPGATQLLLMGQSAIILHYRRLFASYQIESDTLEYFPPETDDLTVLSSCSLAADGTALISAFDNSSNNQTAEYQLYRINSTTVTPLSINGTVGEIYRLRDDLEILPVWLSTHRTTNLYQHLGEGHLTSVAPPSGMIISQTAKVGNGVLCLCMNTPSDQEPRRWHCYYLDSTATFSHIGSMPCYSDVARLNGVVLEDSTYLFSVTHYGAPDGGGTTSHNFHWNPMSATSREIQHDGFVTEIHRLCGISVDPTKGPASLAAFQSIYRELGVVDSPRWASSDGTLTRVTNSETKHLKVAADTAYWIQSTDRGSKLFSCDGSAIPVESPHVDPLLEECVDYHLSSDGLWMRLLIHARDRSYVALRSVDLVE